MDMAKQAERVGRLIEKAQLAEKSEDALKFSQAACNAANAMCAVGAALNSPK